MIGYVCFDKQDVNQDSEFSESGEEDLVVHGVECSRQVKEQEN